MKVERKFKFGPTNRMVYVYEKERWAQNARSEKWGVNRRSFTEPKMFLLLGTGRTSSKFLGHVMRSWGYDVQHEKTGEHGSSTHFFHADADWHPMFPWMTDCAHVGERMSDYDFKNKIHIIRNPLTCIPSIGHIFGTIDWEYAEDTGILPPDSRSMSKYHRIMTYYHELNRRAAKMCDVTIRMEELKFVLPDILREITGFVLPWPKDITPKNKGTGYRRSEPTTYAKLEEIEPTLAKSIRQMAKEYGYEV